MAEVLVIVFAVGLVVSNAVMQVRYANRIAEWKR